MSEPIRSPLIGEIFRDANARSGRCDRLNRREKFRMKPHVARRACRDASTQSRMNKYTMCERGRAFATHLRFARGETRAFRIDMKIVLSK
jgi:hypothetical protein